MITNSREGAKPRSSDEKSTIFRQSPRAASVESFLGKGHPGTGRRPPGGPACARARARAREAGRAWGQEEPGQSKQLFGRLILVPPAFRYYY